MHTAARATIVLALLLTPLAAGAQDLSSPELRISWADFKKSYDAKRIAVVDVRGREAFDEAHIPGAISVPFDDVESRIAELKKLGKPIVLYCS